MFSRVKLISTAALAASIALAAAAPGAPAATFVTPPLPASAKLLACDTDSGVATFRGSLEAIEGSDQLWMRFTLQQRNATGFEAVEAPGLKRWRKSRSGVTRFGYNQTVKGLKSGRAYRALIKFRWYAAGGTLLRSVERRSPICGLGREANLAAVRVRAKPGPSPGTSTYTVAVENQSSLDVQRAVVQLVVDGSELDAGEIMLLRGGETGVVQFTGPICQKAVRAVVDPRNAIAEVDEDDNSLTAPCVKAG